MSLQLIVQQVSLCEAIPSQASLRLWAEAACPLQEPAELLVRIVDAAESRQLNRDYRSKDKPTNVLSFPFQPPPQMPQTGYLGDLVICAPVVAAEAQQQDKPLQHHWAHMVVHGVLHLRGYDHQNETQAIQMEDLERSILATLGIPDPYQQNP